MINGLININKQSDRNIALFIIFQTLINENEKVPYLIQRDFIRELKKRVMIRLSASDINIKNCIRNGKDIYGRDLDQVAIINNYSKYANNFIKDLSEAETNFNSLIL